MAPLAPPLTRARRPPSSPLTTPASPQRDLSHSELLSSLGDVAVPDEYKRAVTAFYSECAGSLREGLRLAPAAAVNRASDGADAPAVTAPVAALSLAVDAAPLPFLPVSGASADIPQLRGLDWRLDVDIARRHVHEVLEPNYLLRLNVYGLGPPAAADAGARAGVDARALSALGPHAITFSADFATLKSAAMAMDEAVAELRTPHAKRVVRYIR